MGSNTCVFCEATSKYVCPRCGVPYCSLACYQSDRHQGCSESFYRDCVQQQLRAEQPDPAVRRRTEEALARQARLQAADEQPDESGADSDDSDSQDELAERLRGVDLDDSEAVWARLTAAEREEFRRQAAGGTIAAESWRPWWTVRGERPKVAELGVEVTPEFVAAAPPVLTEVPPLATLSRQPPSPLVVNSVINVLYAYAWLQLQYDGDWRGAALEVADSLRQLSGCLSRGEVVDTGRAAVDAVDFRVSESGDEADPALRRQSRRAVQQLLAGPNASDAGWYVLAALSDLWRLLDGALAELKAGRHRSRPEPANPAAPSFFREFGPPAAAQPTVTRTDLRRMQKKLEYLFAWSKCHQEVLSERASGPKLDTEIVMPPAAGCAD